ncbi:MAG: hypothetical protein GY913_26100 [Proteobacteria bacterium]|nr:hypothetical protein [Pseudomonadota bacterium]
MPPTPTRRRLILGGFAAAGALAVCSGLTARLPAPGVGLRTLSTREGELVEALGEALWPAGNPIGVAASEVGLSARVDDLLSDVLAGDSVSGFRQILRSLDLTMLPDRLDALEPAERLARLRAWQGPDELVSRVAADALKAVLGIAYFNDDRVLAAVGFDSACHR